MEQADLFTPESAKRAGMAKALLRRGDEWKESVLAIIGQVALRQELLTSDDVYRILEEKQMGAYCLRIIGPLMLRAAKLGYIESTHTVRHSERVSMHSAWVTVWKSKIARIA